MIDLTGKTFGSYQIVRKLGQGGYAVVYEARHRYLAREAAIKVMFPHIAAQPENHARFIREARSASDLAHPNIVEIYEFGEEEGYLFLVMELIRGGSLRTLIEAQKGGRAISLLTALSLVRQAADALGYAHTHGSSVHGRIVHRDIKPDNLLLHRREGDLPEEERYTLKISDFGVARLERGGVQTISGVPIGTPAYMSPEQCKAEKKIDGRSDIYSLGVVLYQVVTGMLPFPTMSLTEAILSHVTRPPLPPSYYRPDLPSQLETIILRCLEKDPADRFQTMEELGAAIDALREELRAGTIGVSEPFFPPTISPAPEETTRYEDEGASAEDGTSYDLSLRPDSQVGVEAIEGLPTDRREGASLLPTERAVPTEIVASPPLRWFRRLLPLLVMLLLIPLRGGMASIAFRYLGRLFGVPPRIAAFVAEPDAYPLGGAAQLTLRWDVRFARRIRIDPKVGERSEGRGEVTLPAPQESQTFRLRAENGAGMEEAVLRVFVYDPAGRGMRRFAGGTFPRGSPEAGEDAQPVRRVELSPFWLDATEVTVEEYEACVTDGFCSPAGEGRHCNAHRYERRHHPINCVDWTQARAFCAWIGGRLPTEAQWEFAARGGEGRRFPWGDTLPEGGTSPMGNFADHSLREILDAAPVIPGYDDGFPTTAPVGSFPPTPEGLFDMAGNVAEWVADGYRRDFYASAPSKDPEAPDTLEERVFRGGSWCNTSNELLAAFRFFESPTFRHPAVGFRCAMPARR